MHLIPIDRTPFENPKGSAYSQMAFDGTYFYCCTGKSSEIFKFTIGGKLVCCIDTKRAYCSLCFDCAETCFWAISSSCHSTIFKLNGCLREIGVIRFSCQDRQYRDIAYAASEDILLLCSTDTVVKISKSGILRPLYSGEKSVRHEAVAQMLDSHLIGCKFPVGCPDIIGVLYPNCRFDYLACMPKQFSFNSMCVSYEGDRHDILYVLAAQSYKYPYLLTYQIVNNEKHKKECPQACCDIIDDDQMVCVSIDATDVQADIVI